MNNPNNSNNNENTGETNEPWAKFADEVAERESPDPRESKKLERELANFQKQYNEFSEKCNIEIPKAIREACDEKHNQIQEAIKKARIAETLAIIPESRKEAFKEYAHDEYASPFSLKYVTDGIYRYGQGESLEDIKESLLAFRYDMGDEEHDRAYGMQIYNQMTSFLE